MNANDLELHDAQILSWSIDVEHQTAMLVMNAYETAGSKSRTPICLRFAGVTNMSSFADLISLADNARSGNVNYWKPAAGAGKTFIYFTDGCLAIDSQRLDIEPLTTGAESQGFAH